MLLKWSAMIVLIENLFAIYAPLMANNNRHYLALNIVSSVFYLTLEGNR